MSTDLAVNFGTISDTWKDPGRWESYTTHLATMDEGADSDGRAMSLARYATFLELYVELDHAERVLARPAAELRDMVLAIR